MNSKEEIENYINEKLEMYSGYANTSEHFEFCNGVCVALQTLAIDVGIVDSIDTLYPSNKK